MAQTPAAVPAVPGALTPEQRVWRWKILVATYFAYAGYYLCRKVFSISKTSIMGEFSMSASQVADIWTAFLVAYMIGQFLNSYLGRKWGPRVLLLGGLGISIVINTIFGFTNSYWTFLGFMFFNGLVQASGWPGCVGGVSHWLRKAERGTIMGFWATNYLVGTILVKSLGAYLLGQYGWRWSFWGCSLATFAIWWLIYFWQRDKPEDAGLPPIVVETDGAGREVEAADTDEVTFADYLRLALNPVIMTMGMAYFCVKFLRYSIDSWLPLFLENLGLSTTQASYNSLLFDFGGIIPAVIAGWALDRVFKGNWAKLCMFMALGLIATYLAVVWFQTNPTAVAICFGLVGFMLYGPDTILCGAASVQVAGEKNGLAAAGLVNGFGSIGPIFQEKVIGWLLDRPHPAEGIRNANLMGLTLSVVFALLMGVIVWRQTLRARRGGA